MRLAEQETRIREGLEDALRRLTETGERLDRFRKQMEVLKKGNGNGNGSGTPDLMSSPDNGEDKL